MLILPEDYRSYFSWISIFVLSFFTKLGSLYQTLVNSYFLICTVEVWGPKRFSSSKYADETSYDLHDDRLYLSLLDYLSGSKSDFYTTSSNIQRHVSADNYFKHKESSSSPSLTSAKNPIVLGPQYDHPHKILYKGEWLTLERIQIPQVTYQDYPYEKIRITSKRCNRALIYDLLDTVVKSSSSDNKKENSVQIHKPKEDPCSCCVSSWEEMGSPRSGRPLNSVILAEGVKEKLVDDLKGFLKAREWYEEREIPYARGYLLYGPPGSGKSSLIKAIASEFNLDICLLSFTSKKLNDYTVSRHINSAPERSLILLEDIDTAFKSREDEFAEPSEQNLSFGGAICSATVTFSGLLNALDGVLVGGSDARIIFMTTNHFERLDSALIRPGRIDMKVCVNYPTDIQIKKMYERFYTKKKDQVVGVSTSDEDADDFVSNVRSCCGDVKVTMAMIQGLLMMHRHEQEKIGVNWNQEARKYFKEQTCPEQRERSRQWGLYV